VRPRTVVLAYLLAVLVWIYAFVDRFRFATDRPVLVLALVALAVGSVAAGYAIGRWWAPALPLLPIPLAVPAGYMPGDRFELPVWVGLLVLAPFELALVLAGTAVREARAP
jgi:hypothetical protein